jgi:hypothetical protein
MTSVRSRPSASVCDGAPVAATLRGQGGGRAVEGRDPPAGRRTLTARKISQVVNLALNEKPPDATHWSERMMAARTGIAPSLVHKIWAAHGLKPHLTKPFKLSRDPNFVAKVEDIVGPVRNKRWNHNTRSSAAINAWPAPRGSCGAAARPPAKS